MVIELQTGKNTVKTMKSNINIGLSGLTVFLGLCQLYTIEGRFTIENTAKNWYEAKQFCQDGGGSLALGDTDERLSQLQSLLLQGGHYWIGLKMISGELTWVNGATNNNNCPGTKSKKQCCTLKKNGALQAFQCDHSKNFICQYVSAPIPSTVAALETITSIHPSYADTNAPSINTKSHTNDETTTSTQTVTTGSPALTTTTTIQMSTPRKELFYTSLTPTSTHTTTKLLPSVAQISSTWSIAPSIVFLKSTSSALLPTDSSATTSRQKGINKIKSFHVFLVSLDENNPNSMKNLMDEFDELLDELEAESLSEEDFNPIVEVQSIESFAMKYTRTHLKSNKTRLQIKSKDIVFSAEKVQQGTNTTVLISSDDPVENTNFITMPKELFKDDVIVVNMVFKINVSDALSKATPELYEGSSHTNTRLNTGIVSLSTYPKLQEPFADGIRIIFEHIQANITKDESEVYCSFWNYSIPSSRNGSWSGRGCQVNSTSATRTICTCNHMTNFAVLMQLKPGKQIDKEHYFALTTITYVGLVLSLIGEAITVFCYGLFLNIQNEKIQIRINLLCTLAGAQIVMIAGINRAQIKGLCVFIAALIHYLYLVSFCWMLMEAIFLYRLVVKVFDIVPTKRHYSYLFAYGCPAVVVLLALLLAEVCTGGIHTYNNRNYCWVNFENQLIWSFVAPVLLIITVNSVLLFCVIKEMFSMNTLKTIGTVEISMIRASCRACVVLLPLLGITWVFGLLSLADIGIAWQYIFTILNATQGLMIFVFHCIWNAELKSAISLRFNQWQSNHSRHFSRGGRVTPDRVLNKNTESPRSSIPMTTGPLNKVNPSSDIDITFNSTVVQGSNKI